MKRPTTKKKTGKAEVLRITVDERLDEALFRVLVARLVPGVARVPVSDIDAWEEEKPVLVGPADWPTVFRVPATLGALAAAAKEILGKTPAGKLPGKSTAGMPSRRLCWNGFQEGQVFITGSFAVVPREGEPTAIRPRPGRRGFLRIDRLDVVQKASSALYAAALTARGA